MKNSNLIFVFTLCFSYMTTAQNIFFADNNLKNALLAASPLNNFAGTGNITGSWETATPEHYAAIDTNNDGEIQPIEAQVITYLMLGGFSISDITGIENFTNLKYLDIGNNPITSLNITSLNHLESLAVHYCQLTSLNLTGLVSLKNLACKVNQIGSLNFSNLPNLEYVHCVNNLLTNLDFTSNPLLNKLVCSYNPNLTTVKIKNGTTQLFPDNSYCIFDGNPNLNYICADTAEIPALLAFQATCAVNNTCVIDSVCALGTESFEANSFKLFPNPANTIVNITSNNKNIKEISLFDMQGRLLKTIEVNNINTQLDISNYQAGTYLITIKTDFGTSNNKLIIE